MTQLLNDLKTHCKFQDMLWEEKLEQMINDYKKWSRKSLHNKPMRELYLAIINILEKERDARGKIDIKNRGIMGYHIGKYTKENREARDSHNDTPKIIPSPFRIKKERIYCLGRKTIQREKFPGAPIGL